MSWLGFAFIAAVVFIPTVIIVRSQRQRHATVYRLVAAPADYTCPAVKVSGYVVRLGSSLQKSWIREEPSGHRIEVQYVYYIYQLFPSHRPIDNRQPTWDRIVVASRHYYGSEGKVTFIGQNQVQLGPISLDEGDREPIRCENGYLFVDISKGGF